MDAITTLLTSRRISSCADVKYVKRYTNMLTTIQGWEATLADSWLKKDSSGQGRMQAVLSGCIAGSRRPAVVEALRIVYCDFPPVRMAGDLIFSLMTKLMSKKNK